MSIINKILNSTGLHVEVNNTITKNVNGVKTPIACNGKQMVTTISNSFRNREQIVLNTHSKTRDCSCLVAEKYIHEALSSKISLIVSSILELCQTLELYNEIQSQKLKKLLFKLTRDFDISSENNLLSKWNRLIEKISEKSLQDGLISLNYKIEHVCVVDEKMIQYFRKINKVSDAEQATFAYLSSYTSVNFPMYELLKNITKNLLLGEQIEKDEIDILISIYQFIFENIDKKNAYSLSDSSLPKDKQNMCTEKIYIVDRIEEATPPFVLLIETFNSLATHIDEIFDEIVDINKSLIKNEKFNLNLAKDEIDELKSGNEFTPYNYSGSPNDIANFIKSNPRIKFDEFNKQLNDEAQKPTQKVTAQHKQQRTQNRSTYQSLGGGSLISLSLLTSQIIDSLNVLDPDDESFEAKMPSKERKRHTYILAGSGSGKTSLMETLLKKDCDKLDHSIIVFDLMGKATNSILKFVDDPNRVILIDPSLHSLITPIINPFRIEKKDELSIELRTKAIINGTDKALSLKDGWSPNMKALLVPTISTLLRKSDAEIDDVQRFMNKEENEDLVNLGKKSPIRGHAKLFNHEFHRQSYDVTRDAISAKFQVFVNDQTFANLVTGTSTIDLEKEINTKGKIIIFKLSSSQRIFARLMIEMIQDIMRQRIKMPDKDIVPTHIYLDEFQNYLTPTIEEILAESRNYKCYVTFAHQTFVQLSPQMQGIVMSNSNIKIVGQCSYKDGKEMAKTLQVDHKTIQDLQQGEFVFKIGAKDAVKYKNTDKFINDITPYHTKQRAKHMKHQLKKYYVYKEKFSLQSSNNVTTATEKPKYDEF